MKLLDFQISLNSLPFQSYEINAQQAIQSYREMQSIAEARKINIQRENTVVDIQRTGIQNKIQNNYKITEKAFLKELKERGNIDDSKEIFFTKPTVKKNKNFEKGLVIDFLV